MNTELATIPMPLQAGPEMRALSRFHRDVTWTGTISAGAFGPGSPPMTAVGEGVHQVIQDGLWIVGDYQQDQFLTDGTFVMRWQLHWVAGWDPVVNEYRATVADCYGHTEILRGWIDGNLLTFQTIGMQPVRIRLFWHIVDGTSMTWRNEVSIDGLPFQLIERYDCRSV